MQQIKKLTWLLVLLLIISATGLSGVLTVSAAPAVLLSYLEPAIPTDTGVVITLADYSVQLKDKSVLEPSDLDWYNGDNKITAFTATQKGVTELVAYKKGDHSVFKKIYVVAKSPAESEYVLFYTGFDSPDDISDWNKTTSSQGVYTVTESTLTIKASSSNPRIYLPEWLAEFGNYRIDTIATQRESTDASRWISIIYRAKNVTSTGTPYYHMAIRNNMRAPGTATTGGVECVSFANNTWNYYQSAGYTEAINPNKFYKFSVLVKDSLVQYQIDDNVVIHLEDLPEISSDKTGGIGLQGNSSNFIIDSIKVSLQREVPDPPPPPAVELFKIPQPESNIRNHVTNVGYLNTAQDYSLFVNKSKAAPATLIFFAEGNDLNAKNGDKATTVAEMLSHKEKDLFIPAFYVSDKNTIDIITTALKNASVCDALFISKDVSLVKYAREKYQMVRGAVDFANLTYNTLDNAKLLEIRGEVNKALALTAILPAKYAVYDYVKELQSNAITVWIAEDNLADMSQAATILTSGADGVVSDNPALLAEAQNTLFVKNTMTRVPLIIGHRGNPSQAPENSISGYLKAIENGAEVVETDIMLTKDNQIVISHDGTIDRTTNGSGTVSNMTLAQIKEYFLWGPNNKFKNTHPNEKMPTLEEMLIAIKPTKGKIFIEIKTGNSKIVSPMVDLIKKHGMESRVTVICFTEAQLLLTQQLLPGMSTGYLLNAITMSNTMDDALIAMFNQLNYTQSSNSTLNVNYGNLSGIFAKVAGDRGVTVWPWTYSTGNTTAFNSHFLWGYNGLTTDDAQLSKDMIKSVKATQNTIFLKSLGATKTFALNSTTYGEAVTDITDNSNTFVKFIEGQDLITVENGVVTAKADTGTATFMLGHKTNTPFSGDNEYVLYAQPITVYLGVDPGKLELVSSSGYTMDDAYLRGVKGETSYDDVVSSFENSESVVVLDKNGNEVTDDKTIIGTGFKVVYTYDGIAVDYVEVVVLGDINGDGKINSLDYLMAKRAFLNNIDLTSVQLKAASINGGDKVLSSDYLKIKRHFLGTFDIFAQTK